MTAASTAIPPSSPTRRLQAWLYRRPRLQLVLLLALPLLALVVMYLGSLALMLVNAFFTLDSFTRKVQPGFSLDNFIDILGSGTYRAITLRTIGMAFLVTVTTAVIGFRWRTSCPGWHRRGRAA